MKPAADLAHHIPRALIAGICAASLTGLSGCAFSETITQKIFEQNKSNEVDLESQKLLVNKIDAKQVSDELPQLVTDENTKDKEDTDQDLPLYGGDTSQALVAQPKAAEQETEQNLTSPDKSKKSTSTKASGNTSKKGKKGKKSTKGKGSKKSTKGGKNPDETGEKETKTGKGKNSKNEIKDYKDYGEYAEIPKDIKHVTAVGEAAVIVSMLGGTEKETPLVGADADFVEDQNVQKVLASKGVKKVAKVWKGDGTEEGDLSSTKKIVDLDPELCFYMEGDDTFTEKQKEELKENSIIPYEIPDMSSASNITYAVRIVGDILEEGGNEDAGKKRDAYLKFHDDLVKKFEDENDGITGGFNFDTGKKVSTNAKALYTLMITDWDQDARYDDANGFLSSAQGAAIADLGYEENPSAYYQSVGGAVNNAATGAWRTLGGKSAAVWQFTTSKASLRWKRWTSIDRQKATYEPDDQGFDTSLMWNMTDKCGLGTKEFPAVVLTSQKQKALLEKDAARANGLYHPYSIVSKGEYATYSSVGFYNGGNLVDACIGTHGMGTVSSLNDGTTVNYYGMYVNPTGLFSDWVNGGVESVLEASWTFSKFRNESYDATADVKNFYQTFYGYELSNAETDVIMNGPES